jgi:peptidoglycan biosynthesis protein MviN/MurJ (putative lipid II flippase)
MLPGLAAFTLMMYAVAPIFQIAKRTAPMVVAALAALGAQAMLIAFLPRVGGGHWLALAQSGALVVGLGVALLFAWAARPQWPRARDLLGALAATGAMALALWPLGAHAPGVTLLAAQAGLGAAVYGALAWIFDIARLRGRLKAMRGPRGAAAEAGSTKNS